MSNSIGCSRRSYMKLSAGLCAGALASDFSLASSASVRACFQAVSGTELGYYLLAFDSDGVERRWGDGSLCSDSVSSHLVEDPVTDVFIFSHGWMGDVIQANNQYDSWIRAMSTCKSDIDKMRSRKVGFSPLLVGVHWPSLPFGDEELRTRFGASSPIIETGAANEKFGNTPRSKMALEHILRSARERKGNALSTDLIDAFKTLRAESVRYEGGVSAAPGSDGDSFDPQELFQAIQKKPREFTVGAAFAKSDPWYYNILYLLATVSFWTMKDRARIVGENGVNRFIRGLQSAVPSGKAVRFHLMGHSFGCIVVSSSLLGVPGRRSSVSPISSLSLVQGALSHWSYSSTVEGSRTPGYFRSIIDQKLVKGPIITTQSALDHAVGTLYPIAAGIARQTVMANEDGPKLPTYGAVGAFGIQGTHCDPKGLEILDIHQTYGFESSNIYNIDCSKVICKEYPLSGAHSDICHPEVAHAVWEAVAHTNSELDTNPIRPQPLPPDPPEPVGPLRRILRRRR